jgi:intracellular multiplication protein IcmO
MYKAENDVFQGRLNAFIACLGPVLRWARRVKGYSPAEADLRAAASLRGVAMIVDDRRLPLAHGDGQGVFDLSGVPDELVSPLRSYLAELPGYDLSKPHRQQRSPLPHQHHGYVLLTGRHTIAASLA